MKTPCGGSLAVLLFLGQGVLAGPFKPWHDRMFQRRQNSDNSTYSLAPGPNAADEGDDVVTSTALATAIYTVTSCAPDVTNCPASGANQTTSLVSTPDGGIQVTTVTIYPSDVPSGSFAAEQTPSATATALGAGRPGSPSGSAIGPGGQFNGSTTATGAAIQPSGPAVTGGVMAQAPPSPPAASNGTALTGPGGSATGLGGTVPTGAAAANNPGVVGVNGTGALTGAAAAAPSASQPVPSVNGSRTTLTVAATTIQTVISCAPSVTSCPGAGETAAISSLASSLGTDAVQTVVTTSTIAVYTTICPVTEASSLSSSILTSMSGALTTASCKSMLMMPMSFQIDTRGTRANNEYSLNQTTDKPLSTCPVLLLPALLRSRARTQPAPVSSHPALWAPTA